VLPVLVDKADRTEDDYPDWVFRVPGQKTKEKMEWMFAPMAHSVVYKRLTKNQQKQLEAITLGITTTAPTIDHSVDDAKAEILGIVGTNIQQEGGEIGGPVAIADADAADAVLSGVPTAARGGRRGNGKVLIQNTEIVRVQIVQNQYRSTKVLLLEFEFWTLLWGHRCQCVGPHGRCSSLLEDPGLCFFCSLNVCNCECYACSGLPDSDSASDSGDNINSLPACLSGFRNTARELFM
jgi:hypothetical protein